PNAKPVPGVMTPTPIHSRRATPAVVTGKPLELGGSQGRTEATGRGLMICCDKAVQKLGMQRRGARVIIQGFGKLGSHAADLMHKAGYKIIGVADIHGGLYNEGGFDIPNPLKGVSGQRKPLPDFPGGGQKMSAQEVLFHPCEILVPAATENQIT